MFREEFIHSRSRKWKAKVILLPGVSMWIYCFFSAVFLVSLISFMMAGSYTRRISVSGEYMTWPQPVYIYSDVQGTVAEQKVKPGQIVKKNEILYTINVSRSTNGGVVSENRKAAINGQIHRLEDTITLLKSSKVVTLNTLASEEKQYRDALLKSSDIVKLAQDGILKLKKNVDNYHDYQQRGLVNKDQVANHTAIYYQQQNNLLNLITQNQQNALQITTIESQMLTQRSEYDSKIYQAEMQLFDLKKEIIDENARTSVSVPALTEGTVQSMNVSPGQNIAQGESLSLIKPRLVESSQIIVFAPDNALPYLKTGSPVKITFAAFPYEKFGFFSGKILSISRVAAPSAEMKKYHFSGDDIKNSGSYYKIIIAPEKSIIRYASSDIPLESGMEAKVTLYLEKRKLYQWVMGPLYALKNSLNEGMSEEKNQIFY